MTGNVVAMATMAICLFNNCPTHIGCEEKKQCEENWVESSSFLHICNRYVQKQPSGVAFILFIICFVKGMHLMYCYFWHITELGLKMNNAPAQMFQLEAIKQLPFA